MRKLPPLPTVSSRELQRYLGTWYEIDRLPLQHEPRDATDVSAFYSLNDDGSLRVQSRCLHHGELEEAIGQAWPVDGNNSRLEVSFPTHDARAAPWGVGDYWVIQLDRSYSTALVGSPDRHSLWLLARQPEMDETTRRHYIAYARQNGFDVDELIHTPHTGHRTA
jgi:apolipoprotein D and lipocalin family protein